MKFTFCGNTFYSHALTQPHSSATTVHMTNTQMLNVSFSIKDSSGPQNTFDLSKCMHKYGRILWLKSVMAGGQGLAWEEEDIPNRCF